MNCLICNTPLTGTNTPLFGATSSDGQKVCTKCHKTVALKLPITSIKKATAEQIRIEYEMYTDKKNNEVQSLENLKAKIREINPTASNKKEVKELLKILMNDEVIENVNTGYL